MLSAACGRPEEAVADGLDGAGDAAPAEPMAGAMERPRATKVQTAPLVQREMVRQISAIVNAESEREIELYPRTGGVVIHVLVEEGDRVETGDPLMRLDARELETAVEQARIAEREARGAIPGLEIAVTEAEARLTRAQLTRDQANRELERKEAAGDVLSLNELDQLRLTAATASADVNVEEFAVERARAAVNTGRIAIDRAENDVAQADLNLSFATVVAPFDGVIARRDVRVGDLVSNASVAFVLSDVDNVRAVVSRPQRELTFFSGRSALRRATNGDGPGASGSSADGLDITLEPDALAGSVYTGHIRFVSPTVDPASGQFRVTIGVDQPGADDPRPPLLPGMQVRVRIVTERHPDALVVPKRALVREGDAYFVYEALDGRARRVRVEEGFSTDDDVEVLLAEGETLQPGADVVVVGNRDLEDGGAVDAVVWPGAARATDAEDA